MDDDTTRNGDDNTTDREGTLLSAVDTVAAFLLNHPVVTLSGILAADVAFYATTGNSVLISLTKTTIGAPLNYMSGFGKSVLSIGWDKASMLAGGVAGGALGYRSGGRNGAIIGFIGGATVGGVGHNIIAEPLTQAWNALPSSAAKAAGWGAGIGGTAGALFSAPGKRLQRFFQSAAIGAVLCAAVDSAPEIARDTEWCYNNTICYNLLIRK